LGIFLTKNKQDFLLQQNSFNRAKFLQDVFKAEFSIEENEDLVIEINNLKMKVQTEQEISIIHEIFWLGIYNLIYAQPIVVLDIGMNTGFASLYFATNENVQAVFGYEPFKKTYEQALSNFALNPSISEKIKPFDYGLGGEEQTLVVEYDYACKASIGVQGIPENLKNKSQSLAKEEIRIKAATEVLDSIISQYPGVDIVAKIDCEGSEYDILKVWQEKGQLGFLKVIMMEWHQKGPDPLVDDLKKAGFAIFSRLPKSTNIGTIYAVRA
jgi:FkbM family methyltransferase